ncbi:trypsin-7 [Anabrus simplex]|uniref:trypsin-7 n=1 Tax=Anabrus simplex TaxID=316456 RepID=UPI0034DD84F0
MLALVFFHFLLLYCGSMTASIPLGEKCNAGTEILLPYHRCSCNPSGFIDSCTPREADNQPHQIETADEEDETHHDPSVLVDEEELNKSCVPGAHVRTYIKRCVCSVNHQYELCIPISGELKVARKGRIVGGHNVNIGSTPYMLAFEFSGSLQCGATIVAPQWAITAAHCFDGGYLPFMYIMKIRAATSKLQEGGFLFKVVKVIIHEKYNENAGDYHFQNDIALIKVHKSFSEMSRIIIPAKLPDSNYRIYAGTMMTVLGWGFNKEDGKLTDHLQAVQVPIVSKEECRQILGKEILTPEMICAGFPEGDKDACQGDSGGPMLLNHTLIGIVSFGEGCGRENLPGVYTRVSAFRDWIDKHIGRQ